MTARAETPKRPVDVALLSWTAGLTVFGWLVLYSASALLGDSRYGDQYFFLKRQMIWTALGMVGLGVAALTPLSWVQRMARPVLIATVVLLVLVLVAGHEVGGAKRWLRVGGLGVQPSEFAKLAVVLVLADYLDRRQSRLTRWSGFLPPLIVTGFVLGLILLERDLGTPFLIGCVAFSLIAMAGAKWRHLFLVGLATIPGLFLALSVPYRRQRLLAFLDPWKESQGVGYQLVQSLMALGSGGFWGKGSGESTIKMYYMPESQTDFIFPIFGEEFGFLGTSLLTTAYFVLTYLCFRVAFRATHWFQALLAAGVALTIGGQVLLNLGVVTGLLPTKGIPLPFLSFGGSSLLVLMTSIGLVLNVSRHRGTPVLSPRGR
ncbi:MAG: putative lipid II flippase FtsW [Elusimicrobia bacterium]|nr:putative lipid II flippase FtsW [Elusimicrobiota bacterium]MBP8004034.1 putative lipid II flippase FtsW [Elusimicrobiota bacterium]